MDGTNGVSPEKAAEGLVKWSQYTMALIVAVWGGISNYFRRINDGYATFSVWRLCSEIFIAGFVGTLIFSLCSDVHMDATMSAAFAGIAGHMGSNAIKPIEDIMKGIYQRYMGGPF